jgi:hypothetical protein
MMRAVLTALMLTMGSACDPKPDDSAVPVPDDSRADSLADSSPLDTGPVEDFDGDGYTTEEGDCDDKHADVHPGATDVPCDDIDSDCDGNGGGAMIAVVEDQEYSDLQMALDAASPVGTVQVCPGTWPVALVLDDFEQVMLMSWSGNADDTVLLGVDGESILTASGPGQLAVDDLTLEGGSGWEGGAVHLMDVAFSSSRGVYRANMSYAGGAIFTGVEALEETSVVVEDCLFEDNSATTYGGAIQLHDTWSSAPGQYGLEITGSSFSNNIAGYWGGVVMFDGDGMELYVDGSSFIDNRVVSNGAGGVFGGVSDETSVYIGDSSFERNEIQGSTGSVFALGYTVTSFVVERTSFIDNTVWGQYSQGGTVFLAVGSGGMEVRDCWFGGNSAPTGAGLYLRVDDDIVGDQIEILIEDTSFVGNVGAEGVGAYVVAQRSGVRLVVNGSSFDGNEAIEGYGLGTNVAGLYFQSSGSDTTVDIEGTSFLGNSTDTEVAALLVYANDGTNTITLRDVLFSGNEAAQHWAGAYLNVGDDGMVTLEDVDFLDNVAGEYVGGLAVSGGQVTIEGGSFLRNTASSEGGAASFSGHVEVTSVDFGEGADDNTPDDVISCDVELGADSSFVYDPDEGLYCE